MSTNGKHDTRTYIWIHRWREFQHYALERDRSPAWVKQYTRQLDDDDYRDLTANARGLLHDLRMAFARSHGKLVMDTRGLGHKLGYRVTKPQLETLNQAGFIEILSRERLDHALETLYPSRAPAPSPELELEKEKEKELAVPEARPPTSALFDDTDDLPIEAPTERQDGFQSIKDLIEESLRGAL